MQTICKWIQEMPKKGKYSFTLEEVAAQFPSFTRERIHQEISRQIAKRLIISAWRGFYAVVLHEYGLEGTVPPSEYIDQLMKYLGRRYYIALLSAARMHGSSHQNPQSYMIMVEGDSLRSSVKGDVLLTLNSLKFFYPHYAGWHECQRAMTVWDWIRSVSYISFIALVGSCGTTVSSYTLHF